MVRGNGIDRAANTVARGSASGNVIAEQQPEAPTAWRGTRDGGGTSTRAATQLVGGLHCYEDRTVEVMKLQSLLPKDGPEGGSRNPFGPGSCAAHL